MADRRVAREARKRPGTEARRYEKLYSMLLDAIPSSVLLIDHQMRIMSANRNFIEKAQRSESETVGQRIDTVFPPAILESMDLVERIRAAFEDHTSTKGERMIYRTPGLATRIYYYSVIPFSWQGTVKHAMLLLEDVTEQVRLGEEARRAERHLASVVESASDIVLSADVDGRILTWNAAAERISDYPLREAEGRKFFELCAPRHQAAVQQAFGRARSGKGFGIAEWELVTKAGSLVPVSWVGSVMKDDQARVVAVVAVGRDLTERRKFEGQLLQSQKLAALGVLAGGIAHEIRNPLSVSSSAAQFLLQDPDDLEFRRECAEKILAGIKRAALIIENLLRFARPGAQPEMAPVDLVPVIRDAVALAATQAAIQHVNIELELPADPVRVSGMPSLLQQVFINLLLNALSAMPAAGLLHVTADEVDAEVQVRISDTGCGMPALEMERIFDPFYTTRPVGKGTGLGLSICYSIVQQHFGVIEVESVKGEGSTFTVRLPLLRDGGVSRCATQ